MQPTASKLEPLSVTIAVCRYAPTMQNSLQQAPWSCEYTEYTVQVKHTPNVLRCRNQQNSHRDVNRIRPFQTFPCWGMPILRTPYVILSEYPACGLACHARVPLHTAARTRELHSPASLVNQQAGNLRRTLLCPCCAVFFTR